MATNYYLILGTTANASREEIKAAFRRRALELHPDTSGLESRPFQELQEAYSVLADPERRRRYDSRLGRQVSHPAYSGPPPEPLVRRRPKAEPLRAVGSTRGFPDVSLAESFEVYRPSFEELFERWWSNFEPFDRPKGEGVEPLVVEVVLESEEAQRGGRVRVWIPARIACSGCGGRGAVGAYECWRCEGQGALLTEQPVQVEYPRGIPDGYAVQIPLDRFGINNFYLTVLFRVGARGFPG